MGNRPLENLEKYLEEWILRLDEPQEFYQGSRCPFAKSAWNNNRAKVVKSFHPDINVFWATVAEECENFNQEFDIIIVVSNSIYDIQNIDSAVDALNIYLNTQNKDLWLLQSCNDLYSMVFIQKITALDDASKILERTPYYDKMRPDVFDKLIIYRRILRNNLQGNKNESK